MAQVRTENTFRFAYYNTTCHIVLLCAFYAWEYWQAGGCIYVV